MELSEREEYRCRVAERPPGTDMLAFKVRHWLLSSLRGQKNLVKARITDLTSLPCLISAFGIDVEFIAVPGTNMTEHRAVIKDQAVLEKFCDFQVPPEALPFFPTR